MKEVLRVLVLEDRYSRIQCAVHLAVDLLHHDQRHILMGDTLDQGVLHHMGERCMAEVVQQDSYPCAVGLVGCYVHTFLPQ